MPMSPSSKVKLRVQRLPLWELTSRRSGYSRTTRLWLYPVPNISSCVDDCMPASGEEHLKYYCNMIRENYPDYWEKDAVPIYWTVCDIHERAPFPVVGMDWDEDVRTFFHTPTNTETGERLNWYRLPVINSRFPEFGEALGWLPSPGQQFAPIRSIIEGPPAGVVKREDAYA